MRFCCGITLYHPSRQELDRVIQYRHVFSHIYIFDNTEYDSTFGVRELFAGDAYSYISHGDNMGLSVAYNEMCRAAIDDGFDFICLLDQDSSFARKDIVKIIDFIRNHDGTNVGVYSPQVVYSREVKDRSPATSVGSRTATEVDWAISSGSFVDLAAYQRTPGFDENYFIDRLDHDYCATIARQGYKTVRVENAFLYQELGERTTKSNRHTWQHAPVRHYYAFRNRLYFYLKKNRRSVLTYLVLAILIIRHVVLVVMCEQHKASKIAMMLRGGVDFVRGRMGKCQKPGG